MKIVLAMIEVVDQVQDLYQWGAKTCGPSSVRYKRPKMQLDFPEQLRDIFDIKSKYRVEMAEKSRFFHDIGEKQLLEQVEGWQGEADMDIGE